MIAVSASNDSQEETMTATTFNQDPRDDERRGYVSEVTECGGCDRVAEMAHVEAEWHGWRHTAAHGICCPACADRLEKPTG